MFSQTTEYALRAITCLAQNRGKALTAEQLSKLTLVPTGYLSKVLQVLAKGGLLRSQRGRHGGFVLAVSPEEIALLRVVQLVDPIQRIKTCPLGLKGHGANLCPLHRKLDDAIALITKSLGNSTVADMLKSSQKSSPLCEVTISRT